MEHYFKTACLIVGLSLAAPSLTAQDQAIKSEGQSADKRLQTANELQKQLEHIKAELVSVKQELRDSSTPSAVISAQVEELQKRAELMGTVLDSIRTGTPSLAAGKPLSTDSPAGARFVQVQPRKGWSVELTNDRGEFATGQNSFCLDFRNIRDHSMADAGAVHTDFTQAIGQVKAVRAVARLTQTEKGRYCGNVTLPTPGMWLVTANYAGPSGKGKALFAPTVK